MKRPISTETDRPERSPPSTGIASSPRLSDADLELQPGDDPDVVWSKALSRGLRQLNQERRKKE